MTDSYGTVRRLGTLEKLKSHVEVVFFDRQVPELMLQDDGHLGRIGLAQTVGDVHVRCVGAKCNIKVMVPGKAFFRCMEKGCAHDPAQRIFDHLVVSQLFVTHAPAFLDHGRPSDLAHIEWGASVARCAPNPAQTCYSLGLD